MKPLFPPLVSVRSFSLSTPGSLERKDASPEISRGRPSHRISAISSLVLGTPVPVGQRSPQLSQDGAPLIARNSRRRAVVTIRLAKRQWERSGVTSTNRDLLGSGSTMDALWGL